MITSEELNNTAHIRLANDKWWRDPTTKAPIERNVGEVLCLIHSEISKAMEANRKDLNGEHLPHRKGLEVELADALLRIRDFADGFNLDIGEAIHEKLAYNKTRKDHSHEERIKPGGKKC